MQIGIGKNQILKVQECLDYKHKYSFYVMQFISLLPILSPN